MVTHASGELIQLYFNVALLCTFGTKPLYPTSAASLSANVSITHLEYVTTVSLLIVVI